MRDANGPDLRRPTAPRDARGAVLGPRVLLAPHGRGWRAESPRIYVWQESRRQAEGWARVLASSRR